MHKFLHSLIMTKEHVYFITCVTIAYVKANKRSLKGVFVCKENCYIVSNKWRICI